MKAKSIYTVMLGVFLLASCNNEDTPLQAGTEPDAPAMNLPEGTFVVDYTASTDGAASRSSANGMISSLDYLLYESTDGSTYTLVKNVAIPDISTNTDWPLKRANMTWAQREALKDTLNTSNSYKAVFVANADASLWDEEVLTGVDDNADFNKARLNLPTQKPFDESNMYFMDVVEVKAPMDGNNYVNQTVLLERVINKIEVKLDDEIASAEDLDAYVTQKLGDFYDTNYVKDDNQGALDKVVWAYMNGIKSFITENLNVLPVPEKAQKKFRDDYIDPDKTRDGQNGDNKTLVIKSINACDDPTCIDDISKRCVKHWLINELKEAFIQRCNWSDIQSVEVIYAKENYPTSIDFYRHYRAEEQTDENVVTKIPSKNGDYCYVWYAFGSNGDESSGLGMVSSVAFKGVDSNFSVSCEKVPGIDLSGGNWNLELVYNPIAAMSVGVADSENPYTRERYNIQNVLSWTWNDFGYRDVVWEESDMIKWVNSLFSESGSENEFTPYTLSLSIPLISIVDVNSWETGKAGN